jgi:hypothetical protein
MEALEGIEGINSYSFLISAVDGVSVTPRPHFVPRERTRDTHCRGGWVGTTAAPDAEGRGNHSALAGEGTRLSSL